MVESGGMHTCILTLARVYCFGKNDNGELDVDLNYSRDYNSEF